MNRLSQLLMLLAPAVALAQLPTIDSVQFPSSNPGYSVYGTGATWPGGILTPTTNSFSLISPSGPAAGYEIRVKYQIRASGGNLVTYLRASNASSPLLAATPTTSTGTFYSVELKDIVVSGSSCSANVTLTKVVAGVHTHVATAGTPCSDGMTLRMVVRNGWIFILRDPEYANGLMMWADPDGLLPGLSYGVGASGQSPGVDNGIVQLTAHALDTTPPATPNSPGVYVVPASNGNPGRVDMQFQGVSDGSNGSGIWLYQVLQLQSNGEWTSQLVKRPNLVQDSMNLTPGALVTFRLHAIDTHYNWSAAREFVVQVPAYATLTDPRQTGVRPSGSYFGGAGEQIDVQSGNLNFTLPLLSTKTRTGASIPISLHYNSQIWRGDSLRTFSYGQDTGVGYGWRLQPGSIVPVYSEIWTVSHYYFVDATGAEYRLEQFDAVNNLWRSKELFLTWDANKRRVYFNDGTWWLMDVESAPGEEDAGTFYPSLIQDSNGNQAKLNYRTGRSSWLANSSSRLQEVIDARNQSGTSYQSTYSFNWTSDEHLASVGPYTFLYSNTVNVVGPRGWNGGNYYGTTKMLTGVSRTDGGMHQFYYDYPEVGGTSAEMATIVLPYGAQLTYYWGGEGFFGGLSLRGVASRVLTVPLNLDGTQTQTTHTISRAQAPDNTAVHPTVTITGPKGKRVWNYAGGNRRATAYLEQDVAGTTLRQTDYVWSTTPVTNVPYVSQTNATLLQPGPGFSTISEQAVDQYGNVTSTIQRGGLSDPTPARTTTMTYLHNTSPNAAAYVAAYIRNRMTKVEVTGVGGTFTPMQVAYDTASIVNDVPEFPPGLLPPPPPSGLALHDSATYTLSYNLRGNATQITKGNATTVVQFIDKAGMVRKSNGPDGVVDIMPPAQWWQYGSVPGAMSLNGVQTGVTYDSMLRITSSTGPEGTGTYTWDSLDRPASKTNPDGSSVKIEYSYAAGAKYTKEVVRNQWTKTWVDGLGRPVRAERGHGGVNLATSWPPRSTPETTVSLVDTRYGDCACTPFGKPVRVSRPRTSTAQPLVWTETVYDALGRTATVTGAPVSGTTGNSGTTTMSYETLDNWGYRQALVTVYDPAGRWKQSRTDVLGNLVQVVEPKPSGGTYFTDYVYNALGQMTTSTMTRDGYQGGVAQASVTQTRSWVYDSVGVLQSQTFPETGTTSFTYEQGKIKTKTDALNRKTEYVYDVTSRRLSEIRRFPAGSTTELTAQRTTYTYDAAGRPYTVSSGSITETFAYSPVGQLASKTVQTLYGTLGMEWGYDSTGRVSQVKLPSGQIQRLIYDAAGRNPNVTDADTGVTDGGGTRSLYDPVTNVTQIWQNDEYTATYDGFGRMSGMQVKPNGGTSATWSQTWGFNDGGQLTNYTLNKDAKYVAVSYAYTAGQESTGKLASATTSVTGLAPTTASYSYDSLGRLSAATATGAQPWAQTYSFDGFGNLAGKTGTFGWGGVSGSLNSAKNQTGNHDAVGNYTHDGGVYDHENRLTQFGVESYWYAADNRRVVRYKSADANSFAEVTFWAGSTRVGVYRYTPAGSGWTLSAVVAQTGWIGGRQVKPQDRLGSDLSGGRMLLPFGEELVPTVNGVDKFATYMRDETGLDYADQRYHIPGGGRFASADPYQASAGAGDPGSWNRYAYVGGDPVNYVDSSGLYAEDPYSITVSASMPLVDYSWAMFFYPGADSRSARARLAREDMSMINSGNGGRRWPSEKQRAQAFDDLSQDCWNKLSSALGKAGNSMSDLAKTAMNAEYYDASSHQNSTLSSMGYTNASSSGQSVSEFLKLNPDTTALALTAKNGILLTNNYFDKLGPNQQNATLVHESLHLLLGGDDAYLKGVLGGAGFSMNAGSSANAVESALEKCYK